MQVDVCNEDSTILLRFASERLLSLDAKTIEEIVQIGEILYFSGLKWGKQYLHKEELQKLIDENERKDSQFMTDKKTLEDKWEHIVSARDAIYRETLQMKETHYEDSAKEYRERIRSLEEQVINAIAISSKLDSLIGKGSTIDNSTKGDFGENVVEQHITNWYPRSSLQDMSGQTAKGDRLWKYGNMRCLIEVKNVQIIKNLDVQKFERDISIGIKDGYCDCAVFVSLKAENIPTKGTFYMEFVDSHPVLYVGGVYKDVHMLKIALDSIIQLQDAMKVFQSDDSEDITAANSLLKDNVSHYVKAMCSRVNDVMKNITSLKTLIAQQEKTVSEMLKSCDMFVKSNPFVMDATTQVSEMNGVSFNEQVQFFVDFYKREKRFPNTGEIPNYKQHIFRDSMSLKNIKVAAQTNLENEK